MRLLGNVLWFVLGGWYLGLTWALGALICALTIVGFPLSRSAIELAKLSAFPFGKKVVHVSGVKNSSSSPLLNLLAFLVNLLWALSFGLSLFLMHLGAGLLSCATIILIPFGLQSFKLAVLSLWPVGRRVVKV